MSKKQNKATLAAQCFIRWWRAIGAELYPDARTVLLTAAGELDRDRLADFAAANNLEILIPRMPSGRYRWNCCGARLSVRSIITERSVQEEIVVSVSAVGLPDPAQGSVSIHDGSSSPEELWLELLTLEGSAGEIGSVRLPDKAQ
ncbi:MAG: hypothetical protein IJ228_05710 [Succinivibrio sp.]|nr:hypothetical protein [Succinivibrio sp.]